MEYSTINMNLYFNEQNKIYTSYNQTLYYPFFEQFINDKPLEFYKEIFKLLEASSYDNKSFFKNQIFTILYYLHQIQIKSKYMIKNKQYTSYIEDNSNNKLFLYQEPTIASDFSSFIIQSKAILDIYFNFIYNNFGRDGIPRGNQSYFNKFKSYTQNHTIEKIQLLYDELNIIKPYIDDILERGNKNSFRNILNHESSIEEHIECCFSCFLDDKKNILLVDADVYKYPLINTTITITETLMYFFIKSLSIILEFDDGKNITLYDCEIKQSDFINFRDYIDESSNENLQITIFNTDGFTLNQIPIDKNNILKNKIELSDLK